ncbi:MAG: DUF58 domain-containing protein [Candidatus Brocadiia bacterium]
MDDERRTADDGRSPSAVPRPSPVVRRPRRRWTFRITAAGWALLPTSILLTLGSINSGLNVTYLLACLAITVFFIGVIAPLWSGRGVDCRREVFDPPYAGEPFDYSLVVTSRRRSAARLVRILDPLGGPDSRLKLVVRIPPKGTVRIPCVGAPLRRGAHPMPPIKWRSGFPFGLAECGARLDAGGELLVYPARGVLARPPASSGKPVAARAGVQSITGHLAEDFRSLREYHPGDSLRRVHWRASAHRGELHVREVERERFAPTLILLDSRIPALSSAAEDPGAVSEREKAVELAVSFAAEVARSAMRQGGNVVIAGYFPQPALLTAAARGSFRFEPNERSATVNANGAAEPDRGDSLDRVMETLARLTPSDAATPDALLPLAARAGLASRGRVVGVSPTSATARSLRAAFAGRPTEIYAVSDAAFSEVFRLVAHREEPLLPLDEPQVHGDGTTSTTNEAQRTSS